MRPHPKIIVLVERRLMDWLSCCGRPLGLLSCLQVPGSFRVIAFLSHHYPCWGRLSGDAAVFESSIPSPACSPFGCGRARKICAQKCPSCIRTQNLWSARHWEEREQVGRDPRYHSGPTLNSEEGKTHDHHYRQGLKDWLYKTPQNSLSIQYLNSLNWGKLKEQCKSLCCKSGEMME